MRLFYALNVPREVAAPLARAQQELRGNWRSVRADQFHITLAFLPDVPAQALEHLKAVGREAAREVPQFSVRLRGTGYFPNEGSPRVWFVKVEAPELEQLAEGVRSRLQVESDDKPFKAHITLARKKGPAPRIAPKQWELAWDVKSYSLIHSTLHKTGPEYETVENFRLARPAPPPQAEPDEPPAPPGHTP